VDDGGRAALDTTVAAQIGPQDVLAIPPEHQAESLTIPALMRQLAADHGDRTAIVFGDDEWTFARLHDEIIAFEQGLLGIGAGKGTRVALLMANRPQFVVAAFAAMGIGSVVCPISTYEPAPRRDDILRQTDAAIFVLQDGLLRSDYLGELLRDHPGVLESTGEPWYDQTLPYLRHVIHFGDGRSGGRLHTWGDIVANAPPVPPQTLTAIESSIHPTDDAMIISTSGTSGVPKGVVHGHRSVVIQFKEIGHQFSITKDDVTWGTYPLFWSAGLAWLFGSGFALGAKLVLQEVFDAGEAVELIAEHRVTIIHMTPPQVPALEQAADADPRDLTSLRIVPRGSLTRHVPRPDDAPWGAAALGLSETMTIASSVPWDGPLELRLNTNGRPLPGTFMKIVDPESRAALPIGEHGEIAIKGTRLMKGYNKRFPETYLDAHGYYMTGDGGFFDDDGYLHWTGRITQTIRTSAANVSPMEVELALSSLPAVKLAAVLGAPDQILGEIVVACVVPQPGATATEEELRTQLKGKLAGYKIPRHVLFVDEPELEMTATGKVRLEKLRDIVSERLAVIAQTS
jgi:fatty-acyl-CoA synthase